MRANKTGANADGFLGFLMRVTQKPRPGAREEPPGWGGGEATLWESWPTPGTC